MVMEKWLAISSLDESLERNASLGLLEEFLCSIWIISF